MLLNGNEVRCRWEFEYLARKKFYLKKKVYLCTRKVDRFVMIATT